MAPKKKEFQVGPPNAGKQENARIGGRAKRKAGGNGRTAKKKHLLKNKT